MCFLFGFIKWSLSCIQRSLTFVLGFWVVATILYALALGLSAGVAFGYDYALAEYKTLARPDARITLRPREYVPEVLVRKSYSNLTDVTAIEDAYLPKIRIPMIKHLREERYEYTPPTLWLYEPSRQYSQRVSPKTHVTGFVKMYYKGTKVRNQVPPKEETYKTTEARDIIPRKLEPIISSETSNTLGSLRVKLVSISTTPKPDPTSTKPIYTSSKFDSTSPKPDSTYAKPETTKRESTTSLWPSSIMRIFQPKSTLFKWRPTKPNKNFFYKTLAASHRRKITEDSYDPEMELRTFRTLVHGKYERLPIRYWDTTSKATAPTEASDYDNDYKNIVYF